MRRAFGTWLYNKMKEDESIYLIVGDIGYKIFDDIQKHFKDRFINIGLCEQSMVGIAAGMALMGLKPYVYTITPFIIERAFEAVKIDIDLNNVNVKLIGYDDYPTQGPTHEATDNASFMKIFKNIISYYPSDTRTTKLALDGSYNMEGPTFIRLQKDKDI